MKDRLGTKIFRFWNGIFMLLMMIACLYPMLYVLFASFSNPVKFIAHQGVLLKPIDFTVAAYEKAFAHPLIINSYLVTIFVLVAGLAVNITLTSLGAYGLTRKKLYFRKLLSFVIVFTMFFQRRTYPFLPYGERFGSIGQRMGIGFSGGNQYV